MTLDIEKYLENLIEREAKISHFQISVDAGKTSKLKSSFKQQIKASFGDKYLLDADYILFFEKPSAWTAKDMKKIFELTDRALGKDANKLSKSDFKPLSSNDADAEEPEQDEPSELEDQEPDELSNEDDEQTDDMPDEGATSTIFLKVTLK